MFSITADKNLKKIKYWIIIVIILILSVLGIIKQFDELTYFEFSLALGGFLQNPLAGFSLSEFIFYRIPNSINSIINTMSLDALFEGGFLAIFSLIFYVAIIAIAVYYPRFYCRILCPYGAVSGLISRFSFLKFKRNPVKCVGRRECGECEKICPLQIRILDEPFEGYTGNGECNLCGKCSEICPYDAVKLSFG
jgi:polyferredoxin